MQGGVERLNKPIIMTATMGNADFAWADAQRRQYFPSERNFLAAHITLFHHLPPQALDEILNLVKATVKNSAPPKTLLQEPMHLGRGVAYKLYSPELLGIRAEFAESFHGLLTRQDQQTPRLHITVQNKVSAKESKALFDQLSNEFEPRPFTISGLAIHYYLDGPWQEIGNWKFRGN